MEYRHPTVVRRYFSTFFDYLLIFVTMGVAGLIPATEQTIVVMRILILAAGLLVYEPIMSSRACTLGQWLLKVRVRVDGKPDARISLPQAYARYVVKCFLGVISLFTVPFTRRQKAIHDMVVGSMMIRT